MQLLKRNGIIIFWILLFADCFLLFQQQYNYHAYLKVLLMPVLCAFIFLNARKKHYTRSKLLVFLGITCAWVGDILLLGNNDTFFLLGMIAFLGTHIFYSIFFFRINILEENENYEGLVIGVLAVTIAYYFMYRFLNDELNLFPQFKIPVYVYAVFIGVMAILAANVFSIRAKRSLAIQYFIPGVILFIVSDATLAIHKFKLTEDAFLEVIVMITYGYAQCLLAQGFTKYLRG